MPRELLEMFRRAADTRPNAPAFTFVGNHVDTYSYGELIERADALAARFETRGLSAEAPLGLLLSNQRDQVLHYLAALSADLVPAILTPPNPKLNRAYYKETMAGVLGRSQFAAIVTDVEQMRLPCTALTPYVLEPATPMRTTRSDFGPRLEAALLQFSSGTTGIKRGVLVTDRAAVAQVRTYGDAIGLDNTDVIVSWLPLYHDMGFMACLNMPLAYGVHTVMIDPIAWVTRPSRFLKAVSDHGGTLAWNPNFAYAFLAQRVSAEDLDGVDLSSVRGLANCSEPVTHASQAAFEKRFRPYGLQENVFWGCYAMAETTFALTHGTPRDPGYLDPVGPEAVTLRAAVQVSVGRPLPGVEMHVVSDDGDTLPDRRVGELRVRSPFTFAGYYNDPDATAACLQAGWYSTGDIGYRVGDAFYVIDRKKDVMIVGGVNVFPRDVEELVSGVPDVIAGRTSAFSEFDPTLESQRVVILFESPIEDPERLARVVVDVRQRVLAAFQIANFDVFAVPPGWLVKSSAGKISRRANQAKWLEAPHRAAGRSRPSIRRR